jgi:hypothetical protein
MALQYTGNSNLQAVTLGAAYTAGSGTMALTSGDGAKLPSTGVFYIRNYNVGGTAVAPASLNVLKVTARSTDTLTVVGGQDGTIDQDLASGTAMVWVMGASALTLLKSDILECCPPSGYPVVADFPVWINQGSSTLTQYGNNVSLYVPAKSSFEARAVLTSTYPTGAYTWKTKYRVLVGLSSYAGGGLALYESGTGKMILFGTRRDSSANAMTLIVYYLNSYSSWNSAPLVAIPNYEYLALADNLTNISLAVSSTGYEWLTVYSASRTAFFSTGPTARGIYGENQNSYASYTTLMESWIE